MKIAVIGTGYVGLVTGTCFAETGNDVICVDTDQSKVDSLSKGEIPFYEPGLKELVTRNIEEGRLSFTTDTAAAVDHAVISFICVGTPSNEDGSADLSYVLQVADAVAESDGETILTVKSTVPVGTGDLVRSHLEKKGKAGLQVCSNPEFLREGAAVQDCLQPDRVVVGTNDRGVADTFRELYAPFVRTGNPLFVMDVRSAEMTKYAANSLLAMRISFMNEISMLCDQVGADITYVRQGIGSDHRIGPQYLFPSIGFGGSCFPKDVRALKSLAESKGVDPKLLTATLEVNDAQKVLFIKRIFDHFGGKPQAKGKRVALWGLAFKAKTDDIRESPALTVIDHLIEAEVDVVVYDPVASDNVEKMYGDKIEYGASAYEILFNADALCVLTEWNQFRHPDMKQIKERLNAPVVFDGRNLYDPQQMRADGFTYHSIGRPESAVPPIRR